MLAQNTKISVIMGCYNCEKTLSASIDSIINQTYSNWEFIICDDCSTDSTYQILLEYNKQYPEKIKVIRNNTNSKLAYSLNHCLKYAQGEYIARMDADDISLPERFEKQVIFLQNNKEFDLVGTAMIPFDENGERSPNILKDKPNKYDLLKGPCFNHATILIKKSVYEKLGGYTVSKRTNRGQDYDLWFRFFAAGYRGYNLKEPLYKVHYSINDFKRRTFKSRIYEAQTMLIGFSLLKYPIRFYFFAAKPFIAGLIPRKIMFEYHKRKFAKK